MQDGRAVVRVVGCAERPAEAIRIVEALSFVGHTQTQQIKCVSPDLHGCWNVRSPHVGRPVGSCRDGITHLIELMKGRRSCTGERNDAVRALGNSARELFLQRPRTSMLMLSVPWEREGRAAR